MPSPPVATAPASNASCVGTDSADRGSAHDPAADRWREPGEYGPRTADEECLAAALTVRWMLLTRRRLSQQPQLHDLTPDQLIDFWADDHLG